MLTVMFLVRQVIQRDLSEFVSVVSHDLKTPLAAIQVYLENLIDGLGGPLTEKQARTLKGAKSNVEHLAGMINDLQDLCRVESGRLQIHRVLFPLKEAAQEVVENLQSVAQEKGVSLRLVEQSDVKVNADWDRIVQVITNLVDNGVKFTPQGGNVEVRVEQVDRKARLCVSDTGPGIPEGQQEAIFERFHQAHRGKGGIGLGLSISRKLVQMHKGRIWVNSQVGKGSQFYFILPAE